MRGKIAFTKAVATGNDFVVVDNRGGMIGRNIAGFARKVCDRKRGVGADGLLLVERSKKADLKMRIFNLDGSEPEMCGNGSRCIALYAKEKKIAPKEMDIETVAGVLSATVRDEMVKVKLTDPRDIKWNLCLMIHKCPYRVNFTNTGVPHVIHFVDDLERVDVKDLGWKIRYHEDFAPAGTNVDFVKVMDKKNIKIRTYERGVEDETLACGTGSVASAIIAAEAEKLDSPITVETRGGEKLKVYFEKDEGEFRNIYLEGRAQLVYEGVIKNV
ncbi:MAG: diaminopimelate epimerase [Candidatus Omnitrophica bacterium]|nr:diaminopimelate epimerase [Candidatus Omnitrophota bacterium]